MRTIRTVFVSLFMVASTTSQCQDTATEVKDMKFEQRTWPAVSNGLVFIEGEFIPPPYVVSRLRNTIFINGRYMDASSQWPASKLVDVIPPAPSPMDSTMPLEITEKTSKYDDVFIKYISEKRRYLFENCGEEKGMAMMVDVYKSMPCVKAAERDTNDPTTIIVTWKEGYVTHVGQVPRKRPQDKTTPEQAAKIFDGLAEGFVNTLKNDGYYIWGNAMVMGAQSGHEIVLRPIANALSSARDEAQFMSIIKTNMPSGVAFSEKAFRSFYQHKDKLPQWEPLLQKRCKGRQ